MDIFESYEMIKKKKDARILCASITTFLMLCNRLQMCHVTACRYSDGVITYKYPQYFQVQNC